MSKGSDLGVVAAADVSGGMPGSVGGGVGCKVVSASSVLATVSSVSTRLGEAWRLLSWLVSSSLGD